MSAAKSISRQTRFRIKGALISCAVSLGMISLTGCSGTRPLITSLSNADKKVVVETMYELQKIGPSAHRAIPRLMDLGCNEDAEIRRIAVETLGGMGKKAQQATVVLSKALCDEDVDVRRAAVIAVGKFKNFPTSIFPNLIACLGDNDKLVRDFSMDVFVELGPAGIGSLVRALGNRNSAIRRSAAESLGRLGPDATIARGALKKACSDNDPEVSRLAGDALKKICVD